MLTRTFKPRVALSALAILSAVPAFAQEPPPPKPSITSMINTDALVDNYARFLARKYDLSADQDAFTQQLIRNKANAFLGQHRDELYGLVDRLFEVRGGGEMTQQELVDWGRRALPLYEQAKGLILTSNTEWRQILNEDQRRIHDEDVQLMNSSFQTTEEQLHRIVSGEMTIDEFRRGSRQAQNATPRSPKAGTAQGSSGQANPPPSGKTPPATPPGSGNAGGTGTARSPDNAPQKGPGVVGPPPAPPAGPPTAQPGPRGQRGRRRDDGRRRGEGFVPPQPGTGIPTTKPTKSPGGNRPSAPAIPESQWESYVREFIQKYRLNDDQAQQARAILKDCQAQAERYTTKHKSEMDELGRKIQAASAGGGKSKELTELNERKTKLMEPIGQIFEQQLKPRLEKLPTRAQRQSVETGKKPAGPAGKGPTHDPRPPAQPPATPPEQPPDQPQEHPESPEAP